MVCNLLWLVAAPDPLLGAGPGGGAPQCVARVAGVGQAGQVARVLARPRPRHHRALARGRRLAAVHGGAAGGRGLPLPQLGAGGGAGAQQLVPRPAAVGRHLAVLGAGHLGLPVVERGGGGAGDGAAPGQGAGPGVVAGDGVPGLLQLVARHAVEGEHRALHQPGGRPASDVAVLYAGKL